MILDSLRVDAGTKRIGEWLFVVSSDDLACECSRRGIIDISSPSGCFPRLKSRVGIAGERNVLRHVMQPQQNNLGTEQEIQDIIVQLEVIKTQMNFWTLLKGLV